MEETKKPKLEPLESSGLYTVDLCNPLKEEIDKIEVCSPKIEVKPCGPVEQAKCLPDIVPYLSGEGAGGDEAMAQQLLLGKKSCIPMCQPFTAHCQPQMECIPKCQPLTAQCQPETFCIPECQPITVQCQPKSTCIPKCQPFVSPCQPTNGPCIPECQPFTDASASCAPATGKPASANPDPSSGQSTLPVQDERLQEIEESLKLIKRDIEEVKRKIAKESASKVSGEGYDSF